MDSAKNGSETFPANKRALRRSSDDLKKFVEEKYRLAGSSVFQSTVLILRTPSRTGGGGARVRMTRVVGIEGTNF